MTLLSGANSVCGRLLNDPHSGTFERLEKLFGLCHRNAIPFRVPLCFDRQFKDVASATESCLCRPFGVSVCPGRERDRDLFDPNVVFQKDEQTLEEKRVAACANQSKHLSGNRIQAVRPERSTCILGYSENSACQKMTGPRDHPAVDVPPRKASPLRPT
jgi:hypothetical protein